MSFLEENSGFYPNSESVSLQQRDSKVIRKYIQHEIT